LYLLIVSPKQPDIGRSIFQTLPGDDDLLLRVSSFSLLMFGIGVPAISKHRERSHSG